MIQLQVIDSGIEFTYLMWVHFLKHLLEIITNFKIIQHRIHTINLHKSKYTYLVLNSEKSSIFLIFSFSSTISDSVLRILRTASDMLVLSKLNLFSKSIFYYPYYFLDNNVFSMLSFNTWIL